MTKEQMISDLEDYYLQQPREERGDLPAAIDYWRNLPLNWLTIEYENIIGVDVIAD